MKIDLADVSRLRGWAVNTPMFRDLSLSQRDRVRKAIGADPDNWTAEAKRYIEAGRKAFG